jgi:hypothetical protein
MSSSRISRKRFKSVSPFSRDPEVLLVILPFITDVPPCRNDPPPIAAHHGGYAAYAVASFRSLEKRPVENVLKIDVLLSSHSRSILGSY